MSEYWVAWGMSMGAVLYAFIAHNRINKLEDDIRELKRVRELSALQEEGGVDDAIIRNQNWRRIL